MLTPEQFQVALTESFEKEIEVWPARSNWPSMAGHPCLRYQVWRRIRWQEMARHDATLQSIFNEGRDHQPRIAARLEKMGFEIVEVDRPFEYAGYSGKIDGKFKSFKGERFPRPIPMEAKTCSPHVFARLNTEADIINAKEHYIRGYRHQLALYMLLDNSETGYYVLKNKLTGWLKLIPSTLDWELADMLVKRSAEIDRFVAEKADPEPISYDDGICGRCGFLQLCYPPKECGEGAELVTDQDFLDDLSEWERLKPLASQYDALDKAISAKVKNHPLIMAGEFMIEGKESPRKGYEVKDTTIWTKKIRRIQAVPSSGQEG